MTSNEGSGYWHQVGSILLGAFIAAVASGLVTYMQGRSQQNQLIFDRRLNALREYATSFNQQGMKVLEQARSMSLEFARMDWVKVQKLSDRDVHNIQSDIWEMEGEQAKLRGILTAQRTIVYALFEMDAPEVHFAETNKERAEDRRWAFSKGRSMKSDAELIKWAAGWASYLEQVVSEAMDEENHDIQKLALQIRATRF